MRNGLIKRFLWGSALSLLFVLCGCYLPSVGICILLAVISTLALLEFYHLLDLTEIPSFRIMGSAAGVLIIVCTWAVTVMNNYSEWELFLVAGFVIAILTRQFPQKHNIQPMATIACTMLGILYVPFLFNYFTKLIFSWPPYELLSPVSRTGRMLAFYLIAVVKATDIGGYVIGSIWGRKKLIFRISPKKSWEGCIGGIVFGLVTSLLFFFIVHGNFGIITMNIRHAVILGILLPFMGIIGDLVESMLKRSAGAEDSSSIIPGLGGVLDIMDSLLFACPVFYIYTKYILTV